MTGRDIATAALRETRVLDPVQPANDELMATALDAGTDLLDTWRADSLYISGVVINTFPFVAGQASYTIGPTGNFNQAYPSSIPTWSLIVDTTAAYPIEQPMGRPLTYDEWQQIRVKTRRSPRPINMYFDEAYQSTPPAASLGNVSFSPVPTVATAAARIYSQVADITELVAATVYTLRPGLRRALKLNLAIELCARFGREPSESLVKRAMDASAVFTRSRIRPREMTRRPEFAIGGSQGRRTFNIYTGSRG